MSDRDDVVQGRSPRGRELDEGALDEVVARVPALPEPLAALGVEIEVARDEGDATGIRKRLYELGVGLARYGVSVGLAVLAASSPGVAASGQLAEALQRAFRLTDGRWLDLARLLGVALKRPSPAAAKCLAFASSPALAALIASRNLFIHGGALGNDAPERTLAALEASSRLLQLPLRVVVGQVPPLVQIRQGVPRRRGVFRRAEEPLAGRLAPGSAFVMLEGAAIPVDPWLPMLDDSLVLLDCPTAAGRPWRGVSPETGEHREHGALDAAIRAFAGVDAAAPQPPTDRPRLVGREVESALILRALNEAAEGSVRSVLLSGVQGAGLSRMLVETTGAAVGLGFATVVNVHGSPDRRAPFGALRAALHESSASDLGELHEAIEHLVTTEDIADRARLDAQLEALEERLLEFARRSSLVLAIDDGQWLDTHTLSLLRLLVERSTHGAKARLGLFVAARAEVQPPPGLTSLMLAVDRDVGAGATRIPLDPLEPGAATKVVEGVGAFAPAVVARVLRGAAGVPFLIVQPLHVWIETGALEWEGGRWAPVMGRGPALDGPVPGLAELVDARLSALFDRGSDAEQVAHFVLAAVSTDGSAPSFGRVLATLAELGAEPRLSARVLDALLDAAVLLRRDGALMLPQPIVAEALAARYRARADADRIERALLAVLAGEPASMREPERLARGFDRLGEVEIASRWYREAITERLRQGAFEAAGALAERLADCEPTRGGRLRAELAAVDALKRNGKLTEAARRCAAVAPSSDPALELARRLAEEAIAAMSGRPALGDLDALIADADTLGHADARVASRLLLARRRRGEVGRAAITDALAVLDASDGEVSDDRYRLLALDLELVYETRTGGVDALRHAAARARAAARELGSTWAELDVANDAAILEADAGDVVTAIAGLADVAERAKLAHFGSLRRLALTNAAALELRASRPSAAAALARVAETESRAAGDERFLAAALAARAESELVNGDAESALLAMDEAITLRERARDKAHSVPFLRRADVREHLGDHAGARADGQLALARALEAANPDAEALARIWLALHAVRVGAAGALEAAEELVNSLSTVEEKLNAPARRRLKQARELLAERGRPP